MPAVDKTAKKTVLTVIAAALLPALCAVPASAATATGQKPSPTETSKSSKPAGPSKSARSQIGGARLGRTGTQVQLGPGAPVLPKDLSGESWIVADAESGAVLASHDAHRRLAPASTLKMLLADTLLPRFPATETHKVLPSDLAGMGEGSSLVGIKENLTYTVHDLWLGVFLRSGNDAVHVLAAMNRGVPKTVRDMQAHADNLQALDTHVVSPDGYDAPGQVSSAYDLTLFARSGLQKKDFRTYCSTATAQFPGMKKKGKKRETFGIQNTNRLLTGADGVTQYKGIAGVKNGNTTHAGATYTAVAERNGHVLLVTVMKPSSTESHAVYKEAARLLDWGFASEGKVTPVGELVAPATSAAAGSGGTAKGGGAKQDGKGGATGNGKASSRPAAAQKGGSTGIGTALAISAGALLLLAAGVFLVHRRWPLPGLVRRSPRR
ncbi:MULTISPECIES: D-alanyl-D-alanine carboxypeptidase family protein [unclassified Streptomyces]|uniref:D-alanyl-D-alanine carboxypeptidase family protein n=1 Tax=unclassified Streptomyces TaxID=2593676 RepID=UPI002E1C0E3E|nr:D-alanyl-D-alanine carboxypeptidase [Streptomyces sp. NBC_01023]